MSRYMILWRRFPRTAFMLATGVVLLLGSFSPLRVPAEAAGASIALIPIATGFNNPIGVDYHEPTNQVLLSVNYSSGFPHNFELVAQNGTRTQFSNISGLTDEVYISTVRTSPCEGGFTVGESFTGTGVPGQIARIAPSGASAQIPWITLPGEPGLLRGGLFQDRHCAFGGDLIVVTNVGNVWRVTAAGVATRLASLGTVLESPLTIPNSPAYGPWAGKILVGSESTGLLYTIDAQGGTQSYGFPGVGEPENLNLIPSNENFFGVDFGSGTLWGAPPSAFSSFVGDVLLGEEFPGNLWAIHWNGTQFQLTLLATVAQWEGAAFAPAGIVNLPPPATSTPTATATATATATPTITPTATVTRTVTPSPAITATPSSTRNPFHLVTVTPSVTPTPFH